MAAVLRAAFEEGERRAPHWSLLAGMNPASIELAAQSDVLGMRTHV